MFCLSNSEEYSCLQSLTKTLFRQGLQNPGKSRFFSFFLNIPCQIIGMSYMVGNMVLSSPFLLKLYNK